jgi:type II secretory pathway pseudopilin PulG
MKMNRRAFTITELLIIIAIVAILAAMLFPEFAGTGEMGAKAKLGSLRSKSIQNIKDLEAALNLYAADYDSRLSDSEHGAGGHPTNTTAPRSWADFNYPYMKAATAGGLVIDSDGQPSSTACNGAFHDPAAPECTTVPLQPAAFALAQGTAWHQQGFSYGVNSGMMVSNAFSDAFELNHHLPDSSIVVSAMDHPEDKVLLASKGTNSTQPLSSGVFNYPFFINLESQYLGLKTSRIDNSGRWIGPDGDDSASPWVGKTLEDGFVVASSYDTDCATATFGQWECGAHPRYRYQGFGVFGFTDGHAKALKKGSLKWYKNLFVKNPGLSGNSWMAVAQVDLAGSMQKAPSVETQPSVGGWGRF